MNRNAMPPTAVSGLAFMTPPTRKRMLIKLTPLIDVVFILLIFFMLASSFLNWRAIDLDAPVRAAAGSATEETAFLIEISADGLTLDGEAMSLETLGADLAAALAAVSDKPAGQDERRVLIAPAEGVSLQRLVAVLDAAKAAGGADIQLVAPADRER